MIDSEKKWPKVLVCCPTYEGKDYCTDAWIKNVQGLSYPNYDIVIADNSENKGGKYFKKLVKYGPGNARSIEVLQTRRAKTSRETIAKSRNQLLDYFKAGNYDYMMSIEIDLLPPEDIIQDLMSYQLPVLTAMYEIGYNDKVGQVGDVGKYALIQQAIRESTTSKQDNSHTEVHCPHCEKILFIHNRTRQLTREEIDEFVDGSVKQVHACGVGCTLINKDIFKLVKEFRVDTKYNYHDDTFFYLDLWNNKVPVFLHTGYNITHDNSDWQAVSDY